MTNMRIHVGAAAIFDDKGRVLCCKRDSSSSHPGKWEFPGGKVEPDEKISDCIVRELNEELNLEIIPIRKLVSVEHSYGSRNVSIHLWHCTLSGECHVMFLYICGIAHFQVNRNHRNLDVIQRWCGFIHTKWFHLIGWKQILQLWIFYKTIIINSC